MSKICDMGLGRKLDHTHSSYGSSYGSQKTANVTVAGTVGWQVFIIYDIHISIICRKYVTWVLVAN